MDRIVVDGRPITQQQMVYIVLNKPDGVICTADPQIDERGRPTAVSLIEGVSARIFPVGRLDFHTRGVLLLTNDGELSEKLTHPRHHVSKTYHVKFQGRLTAAELDQLRDGIELDDGVRTKPLSELLVIRDTESNIWVQMTLEEGRYRQIRRMGDAIGHPVLKLIRVAFADITAQGLKEGEWRRLSDAEVGRLKEQFVDLS